MFEMVVRAKCKKVIQGIYFGYRSTVRKLRDTFIMGNVRMFVIVAHIARLFNIGFKKYQSGVFGDGVSKGLPSLPSRNQRCLGSFWTHTVAETVTSQASFVTRFFLFTSAIWTNAVRGNRAVPKLLMLKGSHTRLITKFLSSSFLNYSHYLNYFTAVLAVIWRGVIQYFGTFVTNFIGGPAAELPSFKCKHKFSLLWILLNISVMKGRVNKVFRKMRGGPVWLGRLAHTQKIR